MSSCSSNNSSALPIGPTGATGPQGPAGNNGANGTNGTTVLYSTRVPSSISSEVFTILGTHTLQSSGSSTTNSLLDIGDSLEIIGSMTIDALVNGGSHITQFKLTIGGSSAMPIGLGYIQTQGGVSTHNFRIVITRFNNTSVAIQYNSFFGSGSSGTSIGGQYQNTEKTNCNDFDSSSNVINIEGLASGCTLTLNSLLILKYKI